MTLGRTAPCALAPLMIWALWAWITPAPEIEASRNAAATEEPGWIGGTLRDPTGAPVADVRVELVVADIFHRHALAATVSREDGTFRFRRDSRRPLPPGVIAIEVLAPGHAPYQHPVHIPTGFEGSLSVGPLLLTRGTRVEGIVLLPSGAPATGGRVYLADSVEPSDSIYFGDPSVAVGADGRFELFAVGRRFLLQAWSPGFVPKCSGFLDTATCGAGPIRIALEEGGSVRGRVTDAEGDPVAGVEVDGLFFIAGARADRSHEACGGDWGTTTDEAGRFEISGISDGSHLRLEFIHPSHRRAAAHHLGRPEEPFEVSLLQGRVLTARFVDSRGEPVFPARAELHTFDGDRVSLWRHGSGYRSDAVHRQTGAGELVCRGFLSRLVEWPAGVGEADLGAVTLERGPVMRVRVEGSGGDPIAGAHIFLVPRDLDDGPSSFGFFVGHTWPFLTNRDGEVLIGGLLEVDYDVTAFVADRGKSSQVARPSRSGRDVVFRIAEAAALACRVRGARDGSTAGFEITVRDPDGDFSHAARADANGDVHLWPLPPGVALDGIAYGPGVLPEKFRCEPLGSGERRTLPSFELGSGTALTCRVTDESGAGIPGAVVAIDNDEVDASFPLHFLEREEPTDEAGRVVVHGLVPGRYEVTVEADGFASREELVDVVEGGSSVTVQLSGRSGPDDVVRWAGRIVSDSGDPVQGVEVTIEPDEYPWGYDDRTDVPVAADGTFDIERSFSGEVSVLLRWGLQERVLVADSMGELPEEIVLPDGADLHVRVIDENGKPFPGSVDLSLTCPDAEEPVGWPYNPKSGALVVEFDGLATTCTRLEATAPGYGISPSEVELDLTAGQLTEVTLTATLLERPSIYTTRVVDGTGAPVPGAIVEVEPIGETDFLRMFLPEVTWTQTDAEGVARWFGLASAECRITVKKRGFMEEVRRGLPEALAGDVVLRVAASLQVHVTEADGTRVDDFEVYLQPVSADAGDLEAEQAARAIVEALWQLLPEEFQIDEGGAREYKGVAPGPHRVLVKTPECFEHMRIVDLRPGRNEKLELTLPPAFPVRGVATIDGEPAADVELEVSSLDRTSGGVATVKTDESGQITLSLRLRGDYSFRWRREGNWSESIRREVSNGSDLRLSFD